MVLWVFYVKEIERFERDNKVKVICEDQHVYVTTAGGECDLEAASQ